MPCVKSGARAGSLYRNLVAHALTLGASGDRAPVRQQPCSLVLLLKCTLIFPGHTFAASQTMSDVLQLRKVVGFRKLSHANTNLSKNT